MAPMVAMRPPGEDTSIIKGCDGRCNEGVGVCMGGKGDPDGAAKTVKTNWIVKVCKAAK